MPKNIYTAITFTPVRGFIQTSRKLRDLYGSIFIISFLAKAICEAANKQGYQVVTPALIPTTQGTPNQIIIAGNTAFPKEVAETAFYQAWKAITKACQQYIEELLPNYNYQWQSHWKSWNNHAWEFFYAAGKPGEIITDVRQKLNQIKYQRAWIGINWTGESSTLSGKDAVAWYGMSNAINPKRIKPDEIDNKIRNFYHDLSQKLSNSIINENEQLSISELIKRLITLRDVARQLELIDPELPNVEIPLTFKEINFTRSENRWTGWFQGDGDKIGGYLQSLVDAGMSETEALHSFSKAMMEWGANLKYQLPKSDFNPQRLDPDGRIIYAGGDNFLGVLYRNYPEPALTASECLQWFYKFPEIWQKHAQNITVSVGFVWAAPGVPQRDVLQHCQEAERSAKSNGRDRIAIKILFNSGTHLEWVCPWWWLETLFTSYRDRNGKKTNPNWTHIYKDVVTLESRHGFYNNKNVALGLLEIYFGKENRAILENPDYWWNNPNSVNNQNFWGIFGEEKSYRKYSFQKQEAINQAINDWVINLAKVGFYLHR